ncbi:hypothetical protein [Pseudophaeobacter sp.]|uniref:hypothetical protein n=1 Tax=Pseudophaeobacter sp. TaxID=1971739 RepID=UPI002624EB90|nr:hypothetical protein [Pseudophaeobacter sp.]
MTRFGKKLLVPQLVKQVLQKSRLASHMSQKLRVSLQSEGEGAEALELRDQASRSLLAQP